MEQRLANIGEERSFNEATVCEMCATFW